MLMSVKVPLCPELELWARESVVEEGPFLTKIIIFVICFVGLHMGLMRNIETPPVTSPQTSAELQSMSQGLSSFPSEPCPVSAGLLAGNENHGVSMGTSASDLNLAAMDEVGFDWSR